MLVGRAEVVIQERQKKHTAAQNLRKGDYSKMKRMFLIVLLVSLFAIPCVVNALDISDPELLLYLPFDDDTDDYSTYGRHGVIVGTANFVEGKIEQALEFKEAGEVRAPYFPLNSMNFSMCMWVNPALTGASEQCVFGQQQSGATNISLHYRIYTSGQVRMGFYSNDLDTAGGAVKAGEWAHICFWLDIDGNARRIYLNGEQIAEDAGKSGIEYLGTAGNTYVGAWSANNQRFNGIIDEVQVWGRALDEDEIQQSMGEFGSIAVNAAGKLASTWGKLKR